MMVFRESHRPVSSFRHDTSDASIHRMLEKKLYSVKDGHFFSTKFCCDENFSESYNNKAISGRRMLIDNVCLMTDNIT